MITFDLRLFRRAVLGAQDHAFEAAAELYLERLDHEVSYRLDDQESELEARALAIVRQCPGCSRAALALLYRAEAFDRQQRLACEAGHEHALATHGFVRAFSGAVEAVRLGLADLLRRDAPREVA